MKATAVSIDLAPKKAHPEDAGFDLLAPKSFMIRAGQTVDVPLGIAVQIPEGYFGLICNKSGLSFRECIRTETGIIDSGYTGMVHVLLTNFGYRDKHFNAGDKISQMVVCKIHPDNEIELVDKLSETERGTNGFGSTGK